MHARTAGSGSHTLLLCAIVRPRGGAVGRCPAPPGGGVPAYRTDEPNPRPPSPFRSHLRVLDLHTGLVSTMELRHPDGEEAHLKDWSCLAIDARGDILVSNNMGLQRITGTECQSLYGESF